MKYGHFDNEKREYVIDRVDLPVSWTNYLGVEDTCVVLNHTAGGYMFYKSPEYHRITRFRGNGVPMDRPGHYVYVRDEDTGEYWSVSWQPVGRPLDQADYRCRHGMSYSVYECDCQGISARQRMTVPIGEAAELWDISLRNDSGRKRRLSVISYCEFSYHLVEIDNQNFQMSLYCAGSSYEDGIIEYDLFYEEFGYQYFTSNFVPDGYECLRDRFIGPYRSESNPVQVENGRLEGHTEKGGNHCGALQKIVELEPGEDARLLFILGEGGRAEGRRVREKYADLAAVDEEYRKLAVFWEEKFSRLQIRTPNQAMDTMINTWNLYQSEVNIMFSRFASFIEVGGRTGLGYRDTAQDAMTIPHSNPEKCRSRIVELLRGLVSEGYGLHLFDPAWFAPDKEEKKPFQSPTVVPTPDKDSMIHGLKDACSDDALCPCLQNDRIEVREAEPYSYCQFIVGRDHSAFGRARHPFMTGSSGWAYFSATRYMLGIRPQLDCLEIDPCIPADWEGFSAVRRWRGAEYRISVENPEGICKGVREIYVEGRKTEKIYPQPEGSICNVKIIMGRD